MARDWSENELQAIVEDYLVMLEHEQQGRSFNKSQHRRALVETIGRTESSIEWKHMNISAVMVSLGLPHIDGYKPQTHYQQALFEAVEHYLRWDGELHRLLTCEKETTLTNPEVLPAKSSLVFDKAPPKFSSSERVVPIDIHRVIRKFEHPAERDARIRALGRAGESFVYGIERVRLKCLGRRDLSDQVKWVARDEGDGTGYDILSFCGKGKNADQKRLLEVKTTNGPKTTPFLITSNELNVSREYPCEFRIVRLYSFRRNARAYRLKPPLEEHTRLSPTVYRASF